MSVVIEFTVDLDPFQGDKLSSDPNAGATYHMLNDKVESKFVGSAPAGSTQIGLDANGKTKMHGHHPSFATANSFPKGKQNTSKSKKVENS